MSMRPTARVVLADLAALAAFPAAAHATTAPVASYGFEDSGAVAGDSSAFGNTGTVSGAVRAPGKFGNAMSFEA